MKYTIKDKIEIEIDELFNDKTLDYFLNYYKQSKKNKYIMIKDKKIRVNNNCVDLNYKLKNNDIVNIEIDKEEVDFIEDTVSADVVYEDEFLLVVNKPAGIIVHKEKNENGALANRVAKYFKDNSIKCSVRYLHRLDEDTQGLVIFSKLKFFQPFFDDCLANKLIKRYYKAVVFGYLDKEKIVDKPIGRDRHNSKKYIVYKNGKNSKTKFIPICNKGKYSLIECELYTGRTHQIRVHLNSEKLYMVNDVLYGKKSYDFKYMGLYAYKIIWTNPINNKKMVVELPSNKDLNYFKMF